jgi:hypothetical protein
MNHRIIILFALLFSSTFSSWATSWQQKVDYTLDVSMDVQQYQYTGNQTITYSNHSPDTLFHLFLHLYNNAFQPGSMMDVRAQNIEDPDSRMLEIQTLTADEIGYLHVMHCQQNGKDVTQEEKGTILKVILNNPILPGKKSTLTLRFEGQVPKQIRRSGRVNKENVQLSMSQWYPKVCAYDEEGWHANPYIGREFYANFGSFDVQVTIDSKYLLAGTGKVVNPKDVKHGYGGYPGLPEGPKTTWHFRADRVHDFVWAADTNYLHKIVPIDSDLEVHLIYKNNPENFANWDSLCRVVPKLFRYVNARFGRYPYDTYSIIQAGDGGMEYPMATLILGNQSIRGLVGVTVHELLHSWYHGVIATNESRYPWMDEGFATYASTITQYYLRSGDSLSVPSMERRTNSAIYLSTDENNEPLTVHSDHYLTNLAYGINAYSRGLTYLNQLSYVIGQDALDKTLKRYFQTYQFKHPTPQDFIHVAEQVSGLELGWYNEYMIGTTRTLDYGIRKVIGNDKETAIELVRKEPFIMPCTVEVELSSGEIYSYGIPLTIMYGAIPDKENQVNLSSWNWVDPLYAFKVEHGIDQIVRIELDAQKKTLDIDRSNNVMYPSEGIQAYFME